ncbi:CHASE2 domain-containing protein [Anaeromyxobacter sp. PSR-1]|uniref:CHASE2 domain-containing protein n=1 Tax=Anaeromyxobacter sp. PSR-1 TaxID=1300915 RepID=UPI0005E1989A|nr:CHASE2 domain-containing protein [Anaeromyxobacter sp. PSR-1]GAO03558.1 CHASE2 domain protein [Anaeromyxobacter sp. PSR-1]
MPQERLASGPRADAGGGGDGSAPQGVLTPERMERWRERLLEAALIGVPLAVIQWAVGRLSARVTSQPWHVLWFVAPLAVAAWLAWQAVVRRRTFRPRGPMRAFLVCYLAVFAVAGAADLLVLTRTTVVYEHEPPRHRLLPAGWGDWRYRVARRYSADQVPLVVVVEPAPGSTTSRSAARFELARLVALAERAGAAGVALDFYFGEEPSPADALLCATVQRARKPVIAGERTVKLPHIHAEAYAPTLEPCFPPERRGHLLAYRDADALVRTVGLRTLRGTPSLSLQVATQLAGGPVAPEGELMQVVFPRDEFLVVAAEELARLDLGDLKDRFLLVGERSDAETFQTPFGPRLGVELHAAAVGTLLTGTWIRRPPAWCGALLLLVACYLLAALAAAGASTGKLFATAAAVTAFVVGGAAISMRLWNVWLDVVYPVAAVWPLAVLLALLRRRLAAASPVRGPAPGDPGRPEAAARGN